MRAYEFMAEAQKGRNLVPSNINAIELRKRQYELLKKRAEWMNKVAELRKKQTDEASKSSRTVKGMAANALRRRRVGIYGLQQR